MTTKTCCQTNTCGTGCQCGNCQNGCNNCGWANCSGCGNWGCGWNNCGNWNCGWNNCGNWNCGWNNCGGWNSCGTCGDSGNWPSTDPMAPGGLLVPRITASGRTMQRCVQVELCVTDLPDCAEAPYTLTSLAACGNSDWELMPGSGKHRVMRVTIPVMAQLRDSCGRSFMVHSSITVDVPIRVGLPGQDPCRGTVTVLPALRLNQRCACENSCGCGNNCGCNTGCGNSCCTPACSDNACFDVFIDVVVDVYVTRWEPSGESITAPCRSDLPLNLPVSCC